MITVAEAEKLINNHAVQLGEESVPLTEAGGRVLKEAIIADRDFPPFDRVTMDGIAILFEHWQQGGGSFKIVGTQAAGTTPMAIQGLNQAIEVMTGAVLPKGSDTVIPYEVIDINNQAGRIAALQMDPQPGQNVHRKGSDRRAGSDIIPPGTILAAPEIGVAATVGKSDLLVIKPPSVAIIATGDELVPVNKVPLPHQIRSSNAATLTESLKTWGIRAEQFHLVDDLKGTTEKLEDLLANYQILIISGGVSKGKFDYVPEALDSLQVTKHFHRIRQRPGKPFWFGTHPNGTVVFALPGNPVSSFMCFTRYLQPWISKMFGIVVPPISATLTHDIHFKPDLTYFAQVKTSLEAGKVLATPVEGHGSGDLANLVDADGFLELPFEKSRFQKGELYPLYLYRPL